MAHTRTSAAAHALRAGLKLVGIKANVAVIFNGQAVRVCPPKSTNFAAAEIETVCREAMVLGMTFVSGLPIDPAHQAQLTGKVQWNFYT